MAKIATDPRIIEGAYIEADGELFRVLGKERDERNCVTGLYVLENCRSVGSAGSWVFRHKVVSATEIAKSYRLVRNAPSDVPRHLDRELTEHCQAQGLNV